MPQNRVDVYIKNVCKEVKWKRAHRAISLELKNHIQDQAEAYIEQGIGNEKAYEMSVLSMGNAKEVGEKFNESYQPRIEWGVIRLTGALLFLGFAIKLFITGDNDYPWELPATILASVIGIVVMILIIKTDLTVLAKRSKAIYFVLSSFILVAMLITKLSETYNTRLYVSLNRKSFYISFLALLYPVIIAGIIYNLRGKKVKGILYSLLYIVFPVVICVKQNSFTTALILLIAYLVLMIVAINNNWFSTNKTMGVLAGVIPLVTLIFSSSELATFGVYKQEYILNALRGAKLFGQGSFRYEIYAARFRFSTDYCLTYLIYRLGWIAFIVISLLLTMFVIKAFKLALKQSSTLAKLISVAVLGTFTAQVIIYYLYNLGFNIMNPLALPLISYGGVSTIVNMVLIGVLLSVFKIGDVISDELDHCAQIKS